MQSSLAQVSQVLPQPRNCVMARPLEDRLFFAGEACSAAMYVGSLAGAYQTGLQAAHDIEKVLKTENK